MARVVEKNATSLNYGSLRPFNPVMDPFPWDTTGNAEMPYNFRRFHALKEN